MRKAITTQEGSLDESSSDSDGGLPPPPQPLDRRQLLSNSYVLGALEHLTSTIPPQLPAAAADVVLRLPANPDARPVTLPYTVQEPDSPVKLPRRITPTIISKPMKHTTMTPLQKYQSLTTMTPDEALKALEITPGFQHVVPTWRKQRMELMEEAANLEDGFIDDAFDPTYLLYQYVIRADPAKQTEEQIRWKHQGFAAAASTSGPSIPRPQKKKTCKALGLDTEEQCKNCQNPKGKRRCLRVGDSSE